MSLVTSRALICFEAPISDRFPRRAPFCVIQMLGSAACVFAAASVPNALASAAFLALGLGVWGTGSSTVFVIVQRIVPARVISTGAGIDNGLANLGSAFCPALIGFLVGATGSYFVGMMLLVAMGLLGGLFSLILAVQEY